MEKVIRHFAPGKNVLSSTLKVVETLREEIKHKENLIKQLREDKKQLGDKLADG